MDLPVNWLKEYTAIDCDIQTFIDEMTLSGSKVESVRNMGAEISNVVVGKILKIDKHPNADKLVVAQVDIGNGKTVQIVTGAKNVFEGAYVPVALDGATLVNGVKIKKGKLRGEISEGMMCSIEELGFTRNDYPEAPENGIYIFSEPQETGADVKKLLELDDDVVEFEITSNRPDCYSILGLAREAAATFRKPFNYPAIALKEEADGDINDMIAVEIKNPELCPRYIARVVKNVKVEPSPQWLRHRLTAAGLRPINNIVDITNYVMLEMGQPMHAFDIDTISDSKIIVRNANEGESITTLDGSVRQLDSSMLVISDCNKAVAVAGVMGGENSKVTDGAHAILFESANFNGTNVRLTAKKLGLRTDASSKYEKGLDPNTAYDAVNRAVQLVEMLGCGEVVKGMVDCYPNKREKKTVKYSIDGINKLLGTSIDSEEAIRLLKLVEIEADGENAVIPTFRPDVETQADIAEEIARFYGYDKIEPTLSTGTPTVGKKSYRQQVVEIIKNTMVSLGFSEAMNYSFESPKVFDKLLIPNDSMERKTVTISNPLGEDFSIMRTVTLNGMLTSLSTNYNRRNAEAFLYETGKIYLPKALPLTELPTEKEMLTVGMYGKVDFYDLKGAVEELTAILGMKQLVKYTSNGNISYMHPGRCADIIINNEIAGFVGEIHPAAASNYDIGTKVYAAVIEIDKLIDNTSLDGVYKPLPKFPSIQRDISMLVNDNINVMQIEDVIKDNGGKLLESAELFDVYKGSQIQENCKSVSYSITFRGDHTLTDDEVNAPMNKILKMLEKELSAVLRDK